MEKRKSGKCLRISPHFTMKLPFSTPFATVSRLAITQLSYVFSKGHITCVYQPKYRRYIYVVMIHNSSTPIHVGNI